MPKRRRKVTTKARESIPDSQIPTQPPQFMDLEIQGSHSHFNFTFPFFSCVLSLIELRCSDGATNWSD